MNKVQNFLIYTKRMILLKYLKFRLLKYIFENNFVRSSKNNYVENSSIMRNAVKDFHILAISLSIT